MLSKKSFSSKRGHFDRAAEIGAKDHHVKWPESCDPLSLAGLYALWPWRWNVLCFKCSFAEFARRLHAGEQKGCTMFRKTDPKMLRLRDEYNKLNVGAGTNEIVLREGLVLNIHPDSREPFQRFCWCIPRMVEEMDLFLALTGGKKRLLDIGAFHGLFSLVFAARDLKCRAIALDPSPLAFAKLLYNIHANDFTDHISPIECALSDSAGQMRMSFEGEQAVTTLSGPRNGESVTAEKMTGDSLCKWLGFVPDVIKIEVEGHEVKVIRGLTGILREAKPLLFVGLHLQRIKQQNDDVGDMFGLLQQAGYRARGSSGFVAFEQLLLSGADQRVVFEYGGDLVTKAPAALRLSS